VLKSSVNYDANAWLGGVPGLCSG